MVLLAQELQVVDGSLDALHLSHCEASAPLEARILKEELSTAVVEVLSEEEPKIYLLKLRGELVLPVGSESWWRLNQTERGGATLRDSTACHALPTIEAGLALMAGPRWPTSDERVCELPVLTLKLLIDDSLRSLSHEKGREDRIDQWMKIDHLDCLVQHKQCSVGRDLVLLADVHLLGVVAGERTADHRQIEIVKQGIARLPLRCLILDLQDFLGIL